MPSKVQIKFKSKNQRTTLKPIVINAFITFINSTTGHY